jgi:hypothetical protein
MSTLETIFMSLHDQSLWLKSIDWQTSTRLCYQNYLTYSDIKMSTATMLRKLVTLKVNRSSMEAVTSSGIWQAASKKGCATDVGSGVPYETLQDANQKDAKEVPAFADAVIIGGGIVGNLPPSPSTLHLSRVYLSINPECIPSSTDYTPSSTECYSEFKWGYSKFNWVYPELLSILRV